MSPSQSVIGGSERIITAIDARGRKLTLRQLTSLDTLRLFKAAGPDLSQNTSWLSMAGLAFSVTEIDGVPIPRPTTETQIEGIVDRLGDEGLAAIADALEESQGEPPPREHVGNLPGTLS
ncbi:hypothetical protein [Rhodopila globiformis]|uniref:hypothetical protein n=1 Tax=Rhodopila globiformis TaxID=1071 RepID=UPI001874DD77|nr:hypothetical protein [Rhodopila globiformis]